MATAPPADIGPRIDRVLRTGEATCDRDLLLFLELSEYPEETYHTLSYSPLYDDGGRIGGMLCVVTEETERVINERRVALLREVAAALTTIKTERDVFEAHRTMSHGRRRRSAVDDHLPVPQSRRCRPRGLVHGV